MDDANEPAPQDEQTSKPQKDKAGHEKYVGRLVTVIKAFGGWMRDPRVGSRRVVFQKSDVLTAAILGYETISGIETAKLVVLGPPPGIPVMCWGVPVGHFRLMDGCTPATQA